MTICSPPHGAMQLGRMQYAPTDDATGGIAPALRRLSALCARRRLQPCVRYSCRCVIYICIYMPHPPCAVRHNMLVEPSDHHPGPVPLGTEPDGAMPRCRDTQGNVTQGVALGWDTLPLQGANASRRWAMTGLGRMQYAPTNRSTPSYNSIQSPKPHFKQNRKPETYAEREIFLISKKKNHPKFTPKPPPQAPQPTP
jgi:hypothetical protein